MNYRHHYHAGNHADVLKHLVHLSILRALAKKEGGVCVLDTHAGAGVYDLLAPAARKTAEADAGIQRLLLNAEDAPPLVQDYLAQIATLNTRLGVPRTVTYYPGSPVITAQVLRPQDQLIACEKHPQEADFLRTHFADFTGDAPCATHHTDGYHAVKAFVPPPKLAGGAGLKRLLVLIDPPFESDADYDAALKAVKTIHSRMAQAVVAVWYPIKLRNEADAWLRRIENSGLRKVLNIELIVNDPTRVGGFNGSGLVILNPPFGLVEALYEPLQWAGKQLSPMQDAVRCEWVVEE